MKDRVLKVRKRAKLNQENFAKRINLTKNYISLIETGNRVPSDRTISDICREFNINENWLRTGQGDMVQSIDMSFGSICADIGVRDPKAKEAIMKYYELSDEDKELWWRFMETFTK